MKTVLIYSFPKELFDLPSHTGIEIENPPYIPEDKQVIDIDYHQFFDKETADKIVLKIESGTNYFPKKMMETWGKEQLTVVFEWMDNKWINNIK